MCGWPSFRAQIRFGRKAAALQADHVDSDQPRPVSCNHRVRRHILRGLRARGENRMRADVAELMHPAHPFDITHSSITQCPASWVELTMMRMVADLAVVRDMNVRHHQRVIGDPRDHSAGFGAAMNRGEFAKACCRRRSRGLKARREISGRAESQPIAANGKKRLRLPIIVLLSIKRVRVDYGLGADADLGSDNRAGTHFHRRIEFRTRVDHGGRMDLDRLFYLLLHFHRGQLRFGSHFVADRAIRRASAIAGGVLDDS